MILGLIAAMDVPDAGLFLAFLPIPLVILLVGVIRKARPGSVWARRYPSRVSKTHQAYCMRRDPVTRKANCRGEWGSRSTRGIIAS